RDLRLRRVVAVDASAYPRRRHAGVLFRGHPGDAVDRTADSAAGIMRSPKATISARYAGMLGQFKLDVAFEAPMHGITALFGPSGAGKTSILRCVAGLNRLPGRLAVGDDVWQDQETGTFRPPHQRPVGYVFQEASLFAHLSVRGNLLYG